MRVVELIFHQLQHYIHKDARNRKFDVKGDEPIFLGYSTRIKAYKCLNKVIDTIIQSTNVGIDEFVDKNDEESKKEPIGYKKNSMFKMIHLILHLYT